MSDLIDFDANLHPLVDSDNRIIIDDFARALVVYIPLAGQAVISAPVAGTLPLIDWEPAEKQDCIWTPTEILISN